MGDSFRDLVLQGAANKRTRRCSARRLWLTTLGTTPRRRQGPYRGQREVSHDIGTRNGSAPRTEGGDLHPPVNTAAGGEQPGEPAAAVCVAPTRPRTRLVRG